MPQSQPKLVVVNDRMQTGYSYALSAPEGRDFDVDFHPELTPKEMLALGVFAGKYMTDCRAEFPADWFKTAKLCHARHDPALNFFDVNASQPLAVWALPQCWRRHLRYWAMDSSNFFPASAPPLIPNPRIAPAPIVRYFFTRSF